jgi:hypothetical protein
MPEPSQRPELLARAAVGTMLEEHRRLYGLDWPIWRDATDHVAATAIFRALSSKISVPGTRSELDAAAFGAHHADRARADAPTDEGAADGAG